MPLFSLFIRRKWHVATPQPPPLSIPMAYPVLNLSDLAILGLLQSRKMISDSECVFRVQQVREQVFHLCELIRRITVHVYDVRADVNVMLRDEIEDGEDDRSEFGYLMNETLLLA
jgi:hypothetical protein